MKSKLYLFFYGFVIGIAVSLVSICIFIKNSNNAAAFLKNGVTNEIAQDQKQTEINVRDRITTVFEILKLKKTSERQLNILKLLNNLTGQELEIILRSVGNMDISSREKSNLKQDIVGRWAEVDPSSLARYYSLLSTEEQSEIFGTIATSWSAYDPASALSWALSLPKNSVSNTAAMVAARSWSRSDPTAFHEWLTTLPDERRIHLVLSCANMRGDAADSKTWAKLLETIPESEQKTSALQKIVSQWVALSPYEAMDYVKQISDMSISTPLLSSVITGLAKSDPQLAFQTMMDIPANPDRDNLLLGVIATWGTKNPTDAAHELLKLEDGTGRTAMLGTLANFWSMNDPQAASKWAMSLPRESGVRDSVLGILVTSLAKRQPALAEQTLQLIENESIRTMTESKIRK
jgi:hypothetical protein